MGGGKWCAEAVLVWEIRNIVAVCRDVESKTVLLRSGPGVRYQKIRELADAKYKLAALIENSRTWVHIVYEKRPYWVHSSLVLQHQPSGVTRQSTNQNRSKNSFLGGLKRKASLGDSGAMETIGRIYENSRNLNLELAYMWMSLALEGAD